jgi:hypothetical protein
MKSSFLLLVVADMLLLGLTAMTGLLISGTAGFSRHFLLGVLAALFTSFVHIVLFMYFVVQDKIMKQACLGGGLDRGFAARTEALKSRALRACVGGILSILVVVTFGAAVGIVAPPEAHLVAAFLGIAVNAGIFAYQYSLLLHYRDVFSHAFSEG